MSDRTSLGGAVQKRDRAGIYAAVPGRGWKGARDGFFNDIEARKRYASGGILWAVYWCGSGICHGDADGPV